jgi:hypothetical protein
VPAPRLVSGGQTGVDRAALDVAVELGLPYGGWCPRGGWAEDLPEPPGLLARYPALREAASPDPAERTERNVRDSGATLILTRPGVSSPGTAIAERCAARLGRPVSVIAVGSAAAPREASAFLDGVESVNVAGPRESEAPGIYAESRRLLLACLGGGA